MEKLMIHEMKTHLEKFDQARCSTRSGGTKISSGENYRIYETGHLKFKR